ncbi:hypothetical protein NP493_28g02018 [Ridgeia piscesae]|uniref:Syndecan n=1 Tax=Ridgeia piscesae TaxID=27915 RepID=A0AAD9PD01_RIDPI|nr:hypothetical protein NP493_28g02018 [Ridgeia piscesae]
MSSHASTNQVPCCCLQDRIHGSGDGPVRSGSEDDEREDGQEDEDGSGFEGSGHYPVSGLTVCQRAATEASENPASKYIPRCNKKGAFTAHQCDKNSADCWCVDSNGKEIAGSRRTHPAKARCSHKDRYPYVIDGKKTGQAEPGDSETPPPVDDDIVIETPKDETKPNADISTLNTDSEPGNDLETKQPISRPSIIGKPGMLAGVICGAVVGLLCAVLLVMFIVYRMRKKDEGSYALDEPKRSPSLTYTKASKDREFFA